MPFNPNIPNATDLISNSQGALLANNGFLDSSFGTDHYQFSDATSNNGKHKILQMPGQSTIPTSTVDPLFYSYLQPAGSIGTLQYVQGVSPSPAQVQSPITPIQSSATGITIPANSSIDVFNFGSSIYCYGYLIGVGKLASGPSAGLPFISTDEFFWTGSAGTTAIGRFFFSGAQLKMNDSAGVGSNNVSWTLVFNRIFTPL